jgi:hypothetical protein
MQQRQVRKSENDSGVEKSKDPKNEATLDSPKPKQPPIKRRNITFLFVIGNLSIGTAFLLPKEWKLSTPVRNHWLLCLSMIWFGMILAISFMESWVKFKAQSLPKHIGVDVGRTVFWALNRGEILLSGLLNFLTFSGPVLQPYQLYALCSTTVILIIQVLVLQPYLDDRAIVYNQTGTPPPQRGRGMHSIYVLFEMLKLTALLSFALTHPNSGLSIKMLPSCLRSFVR